MSRENVEVVRRAYVAFNRRDLATLLQQLDPAVEWLTSGDFAGTDAVYRGHQGVRRWFEVLLGEWDEYRAEPEEFLDAGDEVMVVERLQGRGRTSGVHVAMPYYAVLTVRRARVVRRRSYKRRAEALAAAGLSE
jgi:uncharacterized protein